jgi:MFS family permease
METEKSSLFYTLAGVAFLISTPIAFQLRSRKLMARRAILVMGMWLMGFSMIIRTGNLKQKENLWMVYLAQIVNGSAFSILTTTTFPEIVDSVENRPDYYQYDKESMNLHISGMFVFVSAIAQLLGVFLGSSFAGTWGYNTAFIIIGMTLIAYGCLYGLICGVSEGFDRIRNE